MRRVVFVIAASEVGGAERAVLAWIERLPRFGWEPTLFVQREGALTRLLREGGRDPVVGSGKRLRSPAGYASDLRRLIGLLRRSQPDLVHSSGPKAHLYGGPAAALAHRPALWFLHDIPDRSAWNRTAARVPGAIAANSRITAEAAQSLWGRPPAVVHPGIEVDRFQFDPAARSRLRSEWAVGPHQTVAGYLGRLQPWKGVHVFLEGLARARRSQPSLVGVVVGSPMADLDPDYEPSLHRQAEDLGLLPHSLRFLPFQADPAGVMSALDCLVHVPTTPEPFGMTVVEAMAAGRWVIASGAGGMLETVTPEVGELLPPGDAEAVSEALGRFVSLPQLRERAARRGPERARGFDAELSTGRLASLMETAAP